MLCYYSVNQGRRRRLYHIYDCSKHIITYSLLFFLFIVKEGLLLSLFKIMTNYEFNVLELNERTEAENQYGAFLDNHDTKDIHINCYGFDKFFVEVVFNSESNTITEVRRLKF